MSARRGGAGRWAAPAMALALIAAPAGAGAETLFSTDFQKGSAAGWAPGGQGDVRLTSYAGNVSLRLQDHAEALAEIDTKGAGAVTIKASFAAYLLGPQDACVAEYSTDEGRDWTVFLTVGKAQADGVTLRPGRALHVDVNQTRTLEVRLRASLSIAGASCWGDDISVAAERGAASAAGPTRPLALADLTGGAAKGPVTMAAFAPPASASSPSQRFEGRLVLATSQPASGFEVLRNEPFHIAIDDNIKSLPPFDFAFVQDGAALIPVQRGSIASPHPAWELVLEPGSVWDEAGDQGWSRAALPFALEERNANCLHNGVLTFAFRADGRVTDAYWQISSETCAYFKFNAWGQVKARYLPGPVDGAAAVAAAYRQEVAARLPVRPLADLIAAHPELSAAGFALAPPADGDKPTLYGVVIDGVNYVGGCETRAGPYPFCDVLDLPSYSTAKTVAAALALMRLEALWPGAKAALIADYVPACATADWQGVTFENALNMATGVYRQAGYEADENSPDAYPFYRFETHAEKIGFACRQYHRSAEPGSTWVYRSTDFYVLASAMQAFVRAKLGPQADVYDTLIAGPLWRPLALSPALMQTRRTLDAARQPFFAYGLIYHPDDIARIARWLSVDDGKVAGQPMLDGAMLARAMERDPAHPGMAAGYPHFVYADGTWGRDLAPVLGCQQPTWVPFMSGYGGISVVMPPGGVQYYYFGDSQVWDWGPAAVEINKIRPICR
ncbi:MAG: serine hydrolase domain-containing protein [Caulobacterales bacterium]